jgi:hypothetical protein
MKPLERCHCNRSRHVHMSGSFWDGGKTISGEQSNNDSHLTAIVQAAKCGGESVSSAACATRQLQRDSSCGSLYCCPCAAVFVVDRCDRRESAGAARRDRAAMSGHRIADGTAACESRQKGAPDNVVRDWPELASMSYRPHRLTDRSNDVEGTPVPEWYHSYISAGLVRARSWTGYRGRPGFDGNCEAAWGMPRCRTL